MRSLKVESRIFPYAAFVLRNNFSQNRSSECFRLLLFGNGELGITGFSVDRVLSLNRGAERSCDRA